MTNGAEEPRTGAEGDQVQDQLAADAQTEGAQAGAQAGAETGGDQAAEPSVDAAAEQPGEPDPLETAQQEAAERLADLQRLQAEFVNYKRRVERDRELVRENAVYAVLAPMLDVLDSIDRAREAGEVEGGFKTVADQLERIVANLGLTRFGRPGDEFDPNRHEALSHIGTDPDVTVPTCKHIAKAGYTIGDRVVRAAQVLVVDPEEPSGEEQAASE